MLFTSLQLWAAPEIKNRNVWTNEKLYFDTIAKGCYPLHPITVWFLSNTSEWMQQRSTIAYTAEMFDSIKSSDISYNWLTYIYPIDLLSTGMFDEMLNSEERGIAKSQDCLAYQTIMIKNKGKFSDNHIKVLKAVLICNILQFKFFDRNSCIAGIRYCSGLKENEVSEALKGEKGLENYSCVLSFDESTNRFDINAEAHGKQEYTICVSKKTILMRNYDAIANIDDELKSGMGILSPEPTSFAQDNFINSAEWKFEQRIVNIASINEQFCNSLIYHMNNAVDGEAYRGIIVYVYCGKTMNRDIEIMKFIYKKLNLQDYPIIFSLLIDEKEEWLYYLKCRAVYKSFSNAELEMYSQFVGRDLKNCERRLISDFNKMKLARIVFTQKGIQQSQERIRELCLSKFKSIYSCAIPFSFDGFDKKVTPAAKNSLVTLCRIMFSGNMCNKQAYQGIDPKDKSKIQAVLATNVPTSWQVFDSKYNLCEPKNTKVKKLYLDVMSKIKTGNQQKLALIFKDYRYAPYGLNDYSLFLFIIYVLSLNYRMLQICDGTQPLSKNDFMERYLKSDKKMLDNLLKLRITLREQSNDEILNNIIAEANKLNTVEECSNYLKQLEKAVNNSEEAIEKQKEIVACKQHLNCGIKLYNSLYGSQSALYKAEKFISDESVRFDLEFVVNIIKKLVIPIANTEIDKYSDFYYSNIYCNRVENANRKARELLETNFLKSVSLIKFPYSDLSENRKRYNNVAKILVEINMKPYADILKEKLSKVIQNLELQQKYASTLTEVQRFLSSSSVSIESLDFIGCEEIINRANGWIETFNNASDMNETTKASYLSKFTDLNKKVNERKDDISNIIKQIVTEIAYPKISDSQLRQKINIAISLKPSEKELNVLQNAKQLLDEYFNIKANTVVLIEKSFIEEMEREYNNKWKGTVCDKYYSEWIESIKIEFARLRENWIISNIDKIYSQIDNMSVSQCIQWQTTVSKLPQYLLEEDVNKISALSVKITEKIKLQRINGVVELFESLNDEEKRECLLILNKNNF